MAAPARDLTVSQALQALAPLGVHARADGRVDLPATIEGVTFLYGGKPKTSNSLDPRFAVFLVRFARFLRDEYDVVKVHHMGMWPAGYGQYSHDAGLAIDFAGVETADGTTYNVTRDWGNKPKKPGQYRLSPSDHGYQFFKDVYSFTGDEGDDRCNGSKTVIGTEDSFIRHPDLHDPVAAAKHADHLHLQAGQVQTSSKSCGVPLEWKASHLGGDEHAEGITGRTVLAVGVVVGLGWWFFGRK